TLSGEFLPAQVIYTGKTSACHPQYNVNHWANADTQIDYVERIILPCINKIEKGLSVEDIQPVDLKMSNLKPMGAEWLVQTHKEIHVAAEPELVYNGVHCAGIAEKLNYDF
ncbi:hypothetical protein KUTeg_006601, partial [Tegillarca granosa]